MADTYLCGCRDHEYLVYYAIKEIILWIRTKKLLLKKELTEQAKP